jgi:hypothetical protein
MSIQPQSQLQSEPKKNKTNTFGMIFTILVTLCFFYGIFQLTGLRKNEKKITEQRIKDNEIIAFKNLKLIIEAQKKYIERDWDEDGKNLYAMFYVHLWRSISPEGDPLKLNLIPKKLAFAMDNSSPLQGYYFKDLRHRKTDTYKKKELDYQKEWGVAAIPGSKDRTGVFTFITDQTGKIFAFTRLHSEPIYPYDPKRTGWFPVLTLKDLRALQEKIVYPFNEQSFQ